METASIARKKIVSGILIVPPVFLAIVIGSKHVLRVLVLAAIFLGLREFYRLALPLSKRIERDVTIALGMILSGVMAFGDPYLTAPFSVLILLCLCIVYMVTSENLSSTVSNLGISLLGIVYIGFLLSHISMVRNLQDGKAWTLFLISSVWGGDVGAFVAGSLIGRHKLYPKISPKKTFEGLIGAVFGSTAVALTFRILFLRQADFFLCFWIGMGLGLLGQVGDFTESMLKRSAQVKDSGSLIPGHGGILDRLDSFLFTGPFLHYVLLWHQKAML